MASALNFEIRYVPEVTQAEHGGFMAVCLELNLAASGQTADEARNRLRAIVESFCNALRRKGLLETALEDSGIRKEPKERQPEEEIVSVAA